jgi:hypothetical protein
MSEVIVSYRLRPKPKRKAQPAKLTGSVIVNARKPKEYMQKTAESPDDPEARERVRQFFARMGLTLPEEQK